MSASPANPPDTSQADLGAAQAKITELEQQIKILLDAARTQEAVSLKAVVKFYDTANAIVAEQASTNHALTKDNAAAQNAVQQLTGYMEDIGDAIACQTCFMVASLRMLPCGHSFCAQCIVNTWSLSRPATNCMQCRKPVVLQKPPRRAFKTNDVIAKLVEHGVVGVEEREIADDAWIPFYKTVPNAL